MLQDTTTNGHLKLFCLVDGESTSNAFPLTIPSSETVGELRKLIKVEKAPEFDDIAADKLTLWSILIPDDRNNDERPILLDTTSGKTKLKATTKLSKVFTSELPDDTIHIIVQRPPVTRRWLLFMAWLSGVTNSITAFHSSEQWQQQA
ncbi:hypothetical protein KI688_005350 [Linnemannia hyalina]|uniref:Crinkler effector protein N-terminal domain-containing protein n=1 Tax=Linnemannia hyalina TaxID=64524 RepID=A0A9P7XJK0_9FUNG|nr:hypothetical protein KI688_005350 [Linnemannia hyalina]